MYYSSGNYEAFAHPRKPEGVDHKSAYLIGSGLAALTAACYLVRDGQIRVTADEHGQHETRAKSRQRRDVDKQQARTGEHCVSQTAQLSTKGRKLSVRRMHSS